MHALPELQRAFGAALRDDDAPPPAAVAGGRFSPAARLQVYRNNHRIGLRNALADCYPVLARLVGDGFFAWTAHRYLLAHPPRRGNLHEFGAALPAFLASFEGAARHPWLLDVARLEWARQEAYHAAEHDALDLRRLAAVPAEQQERLRFRLHPACRLLVSRWPLLAILEANTGDGPVDTTVDLDAGGDRLLVSRPDTTVLTESLQPGPFALLESVAAGDVFGEACEQALAVQPELDLGGCVQALLRERVLVDFELRD